MFGDTLIALGANLPGPDGASPLDTCRRAAAALDGLCGLPLRAVSDWWETPADPPDPRSPPYCNGVARLGGTADPEALLRALQALERGAGRARPYLNAPRTLDLDLLAVGDLVRAGPDPILPHPRAHLRPFVLVPLAEVAPDWHHPVTGMSMAELLRGIPAMSMHRL
ncbi:2-amino-4-hydroxy-6-hydroxymethyldihydropteridine diphosphokinase [Roseomonas sp. BN140053]|uniref:2-amino-4-hydroxy-6- hydroxymethyldihydropteridine diphosphokinase n=1 Tax=Roseomonas sp. BN140053 TaxID=3391898 RepID=UPI0039E7AE95